jgi:hypothetical protein
MNVVIRDKAEYHEQTTKLRNVLLLRTSRPSPGRERHRLILPARTPSAPLPFRLNE